MHLFNAFCREIGRLSATSHWFLLFALSIMFGGGLLSCGISAYSLLGPLMAAIIMAVSDAKLRVPPRMFILAQALIGCMIVKSVPVWGGGHFGGNLLLFVGGIFSVIFVSSFLGWALTRMHVLPGTTALWGLSPGAASVMTLISEAYGADPQLVAFMQYLRVILVAVIASSLTHVWGIHSPASPQNLPLFLPIAWRSFSETLLLIGGCVMTVRFIRIPAGALLLPMVIGGVLTHYGWITIELPPGLLMFAYMLVGWRIGLRFTRPLLLHALKTLPQVLFCTLILIAACGGLASLLVLMAHIDPLTAYLATSPGGADTVAIIASSSHVDVPFVMGMQAMRFVAILILGPIIARLLAGRGDGDR